MRREVQIYDCKDDREEWHLAISEHTDVYFSPEWLALHLFEKGARGLLFRYSEGENDWFYPFVIRSLPICYGIEAHDIESAYGYGGPVSQSRDENFLKSARSEFEKWCNLNEVIAEFCMFHPLLSNDHLMCGSLEILRDRETVSLSLNPNHDLKESYSRDGRYMVRRGVREGLVVRELNINTHFDQFVEMYLSAMKFLGTTNFYLFNNNYFQELKKLVSKSGWLMVASRGDEWAAASLFLHGGEYLHYHLSANNFEMKAPGATNMILDAAAIKGAAMGLSEFHLGGGRTSDEKDSLLKFKLSMGDAKNDFMIGKKIHNRSIYDKVVNKWIENNPELEKQQGKRLLKYRLS